MKHRLISIHKDVSTHVNVEFWITTFICECGFTGYAESAFDSHILEMGVEDITDAMMKAFSESFKKDDS